MGRVQCPNCERRLSCGCQLRSASDGVKCCSNCIISYEAELGQTAIDSQVKIQENTTTPTIVGVTYEPIAEKSENGS